MIVTYSAILKIHDFGCDYHCDSHENRDFYKPPAQPLSGDGLDEDGHTYSDRVVAHQQKVDEHETEFIQNLCAQESIDTDVYDCIAVRPSCFIVPFGHTIITISSVIMQYHCHFNFMLRILVFSGLESRPASWSATLVIHECGSHFRVCEGW